MASHYLLALACAAGLTSQVATHCKAQSTTVADTAFVATASKSIVAKTEKFLFPQALLFSGGEFIDYPNHIAGHPYFGEDDYGEVGTVVYENVAYHQIPIYYDVVSDRVIVEHTSQAGFAVKMVLQSDRVNSFDLLNHHFVNLKPDSTLVNFQPGFYDLMYDGNIKAYGKYKKAIHEETTTEKIIGEYLDKTRFYLVKDGVFYQIKGKSSFLKLFKEEKKAYRRFLTETGINFDFAFPFALVKSAEFFDHKQGEK